MLPGPLPSSPSSRRVRTRGSCRPGPLGLASPILVVGIILVASGSVGSSSSGALGVSMGGWHSLAPSEILGDDGGAKLPSSVSLVPPPTSAPETCANGTPSNPFPVAFLPYGYITPNLYGLGNGSVGTDRLCYTGGATGTISNRVHFSSVGGAGGVLAYPHVEYGQDLWGGSPGTMAHGFSLPESDDAAVRSNLWLTNTYSIHDVGKAAYDYVWDNFLSTYKPTPANLSGPGNYSLEIMLWMTTGFEGSPWEYFTDYGATDLPTLVNSSLAEEPWSFSYFCQGYHDNELTVLYFYNGTGDAMNTTSRTFGVNFSAVLDNVNQMIHRTHEGCWSYPANRDSRMYLDDLNVGSEFLTPYPSPYYGTATFRWTISSLCFRFPQGNATVTGVSCP